MGTFKSPTAGLVDFNNDLVGPMYESITTVWDRIFKLVIHTHTPIFSGSYCTQSAIGIMMSSACDAACDVIHCG